jgi:hypothetical protein
LKADLLSGNASVAASLLASLGASLSTSFKGGADAPYVTLK